MKVLKLHIEGQDISAPVMKSGGVLWAHINGRTVAYESQATRARSKNQLVEDPTKITAPMPGKIVKVNCKQGDQVRKDQTLVVMEAMKMEYSLKAHADGVVKNLHCASGQQMTLGDLLVELEIK